MKSKLALLLIPTLLFLSACSSEDEDLKNSEKPQAADMQIYETSDFFIPLPNDWEILEQDSFTSNIPKETIVGFRNNIKNEIFTANINISKTTVEEGLDSRDFAKSTLAKAKNSLISFQELNTENYQFSKGDEKMETYMIDFEGKKTASEPIIHFKQLYAVDDENGYTVTAAYLPNEDESVVNKLTEMLKSFSLK